MTEITKEPVIRFKGFSDALKQYKVDEIATDVERSIDMKDDEAYQLVTVKRRNEGVVSRGFLKGKDILVKNYFEIRAGDYIISKRQVIHGANGFVPESLDKSVVSNEYLVIVSNDLISTKFWTLISQRYKMYKMFFLSSYGVDVEKMVFNVEDWKKRSITIPAVAEQNRIVEFFDKLDRLITLHQRKFEKLQNVKKAMLEKMFPKNDSGVPEIRFVGFTDAWEQRKVSEIANLYYGGGTPSTLKEEYWHGVIPWIQSSDIAEDDVLNVSPRKFISQQAVNHSAAKIVPNDSIAVITRVGVGKLAFMPFSYTTSQDFLSLSKLNVDGHFAVYSLYRKLQNDLNMVQGTSIKGITKEELLAKEIAVPEIREQIQIGSYFRKLDDLITLHQRKLEKLQNVKKACLEKMFV